METMGTGTVGSDACVEETSCGGAGMTIYGDGGYDFDSRHSRKQLRENGGSVLSGKCNQMTRRRRICWNDGDS